MPVGPYLMQCTNVLGRDLLSAMDDSIFVLYDSEDEYAQLMTEFLKEHKNIPWQIHTYTSVENLLKEEAREKISMLVVAESVYSEELKKLQPQRIVVLNESGVIKWDKICNINKYQQAENVLRELLEVYMEIAAKQLPRLMKSNSAQFIGIYSPVRRCLQTSYALTMAQLLAEEHRTLYLNFEHYAGITELLPDMQTRDMADLLYFLTAQQDKFRLRMQTILMHKGRLDYVPPMRAGQNLLAVTGTEWLQLLQKIEELGEYEFVILDLSESMQGLFDILRFCIKIFTLTKEDRLAQSKILQYEQLLQLYDYEDVMEKTCKCALPQIHRLSEDLEQLTRGELAEFVKKQIKDICSRDSGEVHKQHNL